MSGAASSTRKRARTGFTLIELLVAMALFALISVAGFAMLSGIIGTRDRLDGRLENLAQLQRAMYLMTLDFEAMGSGAIEAEGSQIAFRRSAPVVASGGLEVRYRVADRALHRLTGTGADQTVVANVTGAEWRFLEAGGWVDRPTVVPSPTGGPGVPIRPRAVEVTLTIADDRGGLSGRLRRVVELPRQP